MRWTGPDGFEADDDVARIDVDVVHGFLTTSYWAPGIPREVVAQSVAGSLNLGVFAADGAMVAFARMVTDRATFGWLADVFVLPSHRGHGLGRFVVSTLLEHPELKGYGGSCWGPRTRMSCTAPTASRRSPSPIA